MDERASFTGTLFVAGREGQTQVRLRCAPLGLQAEAGDRTAWELPYEGMEISRGGMSGDMLFCRTGDGALTACCRERGFATALRQAAGARLADGIIPVERAARSVGRRPALIWGVLAAVLLALTVGGWLLVGWAFDRAVEATPISLDQQLGDQAANEVAGFGRAVELPAVTAVVTEIIQRLEPHAATPGFTYRFSVIDNDQVNAMAMPGGRIIIFTGLLRQAERAEQVAGVLAHEISHVTKRHTIRRLYQGAGIFLVLQAAVGDATGLAGAASQGAVMAAMTKSSRDDEREADAEGARMLCAAGLDPTGMAEFFTLMKGVPGSELPGVAAWFSTHPEHDERIANLRALIPTLPKGTPVPLRADWAAAKAAVAALHGAGKP
jgi:Zn-dependent protease with chaperone function